MEKRAARAADDRSRLADGHRLPVGKRRPITHPSLQRRPAVVRITVVDLLKSHEHGKFGVPGVYY